MLTSRHEACQPKQLLLTGEKSLQQESALRVASPDLFHPVTVIASAEHRFVIAEQLRGIGSGSVVVNGTAEVHVDGEQKLLAENESVYIPLGAVHRLANPGRVPLNLIEVQSGAYLGEDDIVRIEDVYARP